MYFLLCAHADSMSLALRPKCGRQDHRGSSGIKKKVKSCVEMSALSDAARITKLSASLLNVNAKYCFLLGKADSHQ